MEFFQNTCGFTSDRSRRIAAATRGMVLTLKFDKNSVRYITLNLQCLSRTVLVCHFKSKNFFNFLFVFKQKKKVHYTHTKILDFSLTFNPYMSVKNVDFLQFSVFFFNKKFLQFSFKFKCKELFYLICPYKGFKNVRFSSIFLLF